MMNTLYSDVARKLIEYSFNKQRAFMYRQNMDRLDYIEEFCTIRIKGPRQSGHSVAVSNLARVYDAVIVTPTVEIGNINHKDWEKRCSVRSIPRNGLWSTRVVLCDGTADLDLRKVETLHNMSAGLEVFALVYLG